MFVGYQEGHLSSYILASNPLSINWLMDGKMAAKIIVHNV